MVRLSILLALIALLAGCHAVRSRSNVVSFVEVDGSGHEVRRLTFALSNEPARTCISGNWKMAKAIDDRAGYTQKPAYTLENGRLEVLLVNSMCDAYNSYVGELSDARFRGDHVVYGLGYNKTLGTVSGTYMPAGNVARNHP